MTACQLRYCVIYVSLFVLFGVPSFSPAAPTSLSLAISIREGETKPLPLLPVIVELQLRNDSDTTYILPPAALGVENAHDRTQRLPCYRWEVVCPGNLKKTVLQADWVNWDWTRGGGELVSSLGPGEAVTVDFCLGFGFSQISGEGDRGDTPQSVAGSVFPDLGQYRVRLELPRLGSAGIKSNDILVVVSRPERPTEATALEILTRSHVPEIFLVPPYSRIPRGEDPFLKYSRLLAGVEQLRDEMLLVCQQILRQSEDSVYAPYARLFVAGSMSELWLQPDSKGQIGPDVKKRLEGIALLRQCGGDGNLPRRYREVALDKLISAAKALQQYTQQTASDQVRSSETLLAEPVDFRTVGPLSALELAYRAFCGRVEERRSFENALRNLFTPREIVLFRQAVETNETVQEALGVAPMQRDLQTHIDWAVNELRKIPWRDPLTGDSRMKLVLTDIGR